MGDTEAGLLRAILAEPDDDTPRLAYADWLQENAGEAACPHCAYDGCVQWGEPCKTCGGTHRLPDGRRERAEFIRVQCELAGLPTTAALPAEYHAGPIPFEFLPKPLYQSEAVQRVVRRDAELRRRERELLSARESEWVADAVLRFAGDSPVGIRDLLWEFRRGFVGHLTCPAASWLAVGDAVVRHHPVREVTLTTWPEVEAIYPAPSVRLRGRTAVARAPYGRPDAEVTAELLAAEWPGVTFKLPTDPEPLTPHTIPGGALVAPEMDGVL